MRFLLINFFVFPPLKQEVSLKAELGQELGLFFFGFSDFSSQHQEGPLLGLVSQIGGKVQRLQTYLGCI